MPTRLPPTDAVYWRGALLDPRTAELLDDAAAELEAGDPRLRLEPSQGSWSTSVGASGGTHAGAGAVDLRMRLASGLILSTAQGLRIVDHLRRRGAAAWLRDDLPGVWPRHVHAIVYGPDPKQNTTGLAPAAHAQVLEYLAGGDGLVGDRPDPHGRPNPVPTWETYKRERDAIMPRLSEEDVARIAAAVWAHRLPYKATPNPDDRYPAAQLLDEAATQATYATREARAGREARQ